MLTTRLSVLSTALAILLAALPMQAQAQTPAALVLDVTGASEPPVEAFGELSPGETVKLDAGTSLTFLHYFTCEEVTVEGGDLVLSEQRYTTRGGKVVGVERSRCPKTVVLNESRQIGGVVLRSGGSKALPFAARPAFVLAGAQRGSVAAVRVKDGDSVVLKTAVGGRHFDWPVNAPDLAEKDGYILDLLDASGAVIKSVDFKVRARSGREQMVVLRLD